MLVFPVFHFLSTDFVASIIPPWIPWHLFWTYFTAVNIFAAGLCIVFKKYARLTATLLGVEIFLFWALIHLFLLFHRAGDRWAESAMFGEMPGRWINSFKDFGLSGAAFLFAGTQSQTWRRTGKDRVFDLGRVILCISIAGFGVLHFVYPAFAPGIPPMQKNVLFPFPGQLFWVYLTGAYFVASATAIAANDRVRTIAALFAFVALAFELLIRVPIFIATPIAMTGDFLKDVGVIGGALILAECTKDTQPT